MSDASAVLVFTRPKPQTMAAMRALGVARGPEDSGQARILRQAVVEAGRASVDVTGGWVVLGWDADTEGVWAGDGLGAVRSVRVPQPKLARALIAAVRCCWPDPRAPLYPGVAALRDDVLAAYVSMGSIGGTDEDDTAHGVLNHAKGALVTLEAARLVEFHAGSNTVTLGPVIATWPERDVVALRANWDRFPAPLVSRTDADT